MFKKAEFAANIRKRRKMLKMTMDDVACAIGVSRRSLLAWENPSTDTMPRNFDVLVRWCSSLGLTLAEALDSRLLPDDEIPIDPEHQLYLRRFHQRYLTNPQFASLIHRIAIWDDEAVRSADTFLKITANSTSKDSLEKMDAAWARAVNLDAP